MVSLPQNNFTWGSSPWLDEYFNATNEPWNSEWYGAAPGEYMARMSRQAAAWKRNQLEVKAQKDAELTRQAMEAQKKSMQDSFYERKRGFQQQFAQQRDQYNAQYAQYLTQNQDLKNTYQGRLTADYAGLEGALTNLLNSYDTAYGKFGQQLDAGMARFNSLGQQAQAAGGGGNYPTDTPSPFIPQFYTPDLMGIMSGYNQATPLLQQGINTLNETYGNWNPGKIEQVLNPIQQQYQAQQQNVNAGINQLATLIGNAPVQAGVYGSADLAGAYAGQENFNQQLRSMEQGVLSQLANMFNLASSFAANAENMQQGEKANRLNEKEALTAQKSEAELGAKRNQYEQNAAQQVSDRLGATGMSFNPEQTNLLSLLTRGV